MEKRDLLFVVLLICLILVTGFVIAQNGNGVDESVNEDEVISGDEPDEFIKAPEIGDIKEKTSEFIEKEIAVPANLQNVARFIFGIKEDVSLQKLVIMITIWVMLFAVFWSIFSIMPLFGDGTITRLIGVLALTALIAFTGVNAFFAQLLLDFAYVAFGGWWSVVIFLVTIIILILVFYVFNMVLKPMLQQSAIESAGRTGARGAAGMKAGEELLEEVAGD